LFAATLPPVDVPITKLVPVVRVVIMSGIPAAVQVFDRSVPKELSCIAIIWLFCVTAEVFTVTDELPLGMTTAPAVAVVHTAGAAPDAHVTMSAYDVAVSCPFTPRLSTVVVPTTFLRSSEAAALAVFVIVRKSSTNVTPPAFQVEV
jgi:hypothetical protein